MSNLLDALLSSGPAGRRQVLTIRGEDVRQMRPHWRGQGRLRTLEVVLEGGDVVLLDPVALRLLDEALAHLPAFRTE